jgi:hypothetical protein
MLAHVGADERADTTRDSGVQFQGLEPRYNERSGCILKLITRLTDAIT